MKKEILKKILDSHKNVRQNILNQAKAESFIDSLIGFFYPHLSKEVLHNESEINQKIIQLKTELESILEPYCSNYKLDHRLLVKDFFESAQKIFENLNLDAIAILNGDPAAKSIDEVIIAYPGFYSIAVYRFANWFYDQGLSLLPRVLTEYAHKKTGIDIHPGATIGASFCIDHGTGIVIGETTIIKDNVKIYQGVTLGGLTVGKTMQGSKRHPTIEQGVVIYANATILGGETVIGENSVIGGNVWLTSSVPANSKVYHKSDIVIK